MQNKPKSMDETKFLPEAWFRENMDRKKVPVNKHKKSSNIFSA